MVIGIFGIILLTLGLLSVALQRYYSSVPAKELKRLAARGDHLAEALYRPVSYGASMRFLLWMVFSFSFSFGVIFVANGMPGLLAFVTVALTMAAVVVLQSVRLTVRSAGIAVRAAPALNWMLSYLHGPFDMMARAFNKYRIRSTHSGLYEKEDLLALLKQQKEQVDNRISHHDLGVLEKIMQFGEQQAADVLLPMSRVKMVRLDDHVGPILLKELHDSGQSSFLVYDQSPEHVVGTLLLRDAVRAKEGGKVNELVRKNLSYAHEDFSLTQVLRAFAQTGQNMLVVINSFEEAIGVITLEQFLAEIIGAAAVEEVMPYEDRASVATFRPAEPVADLVGQEDVQPQADSTGQAVQE